MLITVNGQSHETEEGATIAGLIHSLGLEPRGLAVERNLELAPRSEHATVRLAPGDRIEIVTLVGGG